MQNNPFGFVTIAIGKVKYLELAVDMVLSLRQFHDDPVCLLCDEAMATVAQQNFADVFDYIIPFSDKLVHPLASNFLLSKYAPFERALYLDADIIVLSSLSDYIAETETKPVTMIGSFVNAGSGEKHHNISIDALIAAFDVPRFFKNHSGILGYQRDAARDFFEKSHEIYKQLYTRKWRWRGFVGNELAFGIAAAYGGVSRMQEPFPVIWPEEIVGLRPHEAPKPLLHFIAMPPEDTFEVLMKQVALRRRSANLPDNSAVYWRTKGKSSQINVIARKALSARTATIKALKNWTIAGPTRSHGNSNEDGEKNSHSPRVISSIAQGDDDMNPPKKLYFHHLKKCGGTSLNRWIDAHFSVYENDLSAIQKTAYSSHPDETNHALKDKLRLREFARAAMQQRDVLYDHAPLANFVPRETYRFTMLRQSIPRLLSQRRDWQNLSDTDIANAGPQIRPALRNARTSRLKEFLEESAVGASPSRLMLDNYMVRALAQNRVGILSIETENAGKLLPIAMDVLSEDFHLVGVLENEKSARQKLAQVMGWCPPTELAHLNTVKIAEDTNDEILEASDVIGELTQYDQRLYEIARKLSSEQTSDVGQWDIEDFEKTHVEQTLAQLNPAERNGALVYSAARPVCSSGHRGRENCDALVSLVLNIPQNFTLYIPVPRRRAGEIFVSMLGFNTDALKHSFQVRLNGQIAQHVLEDTGLGQITIRVSNISPQAFLRFELIFADKNNASRWGEVHDIGMVEYGWLPTA